MFMDESCTIDDLSDNNMSRNDSKRLKSQFAIFKRLHNGGASLFGEFYTANSGWSVAENSTKYNVKLKNATF